MTTKKMWMGTREYATWVPAALVNRDFSSVGYSSKQGFLSGGVDVRRSFGSHKEYNLAWGLNSRDELRKIDDLAKGLWGSGLIYFLDPFAVDKNLLPPHWASPMLSELDFPPLVGDESPDVTLTPTNSLNYPIKTAQYGAGDGKTLYIPVPPGHNLWVGVHGPTDADSIVARGVVSPVNVTPDTAIEQLAVTDLTRFSDSFSGDEYMGVEFEVLPGANYTGAIVQVLPSNVVPSTGGFISGQGNSGGRFESEPRTEAYSAAIDKVAMSVTLVEVGSWL